jgi:mRNA-degrading endonuclease RelE of RelBE toxin-antitoxin system
MELMSEDSAIEVRFTLPFKRRLKSLSKRYRQIQKDIQPIIDQLQAGDFVGNAPKGSRPKG